MPVTKLHTNYGVKIAAVLLGGITQQNIDKGNEIRGEAVSGEAFSRRKSIQRRKPTASFTTLAVAKALANIPLTGVDIATLTGGLTFYAQQMKKSSTREIGALHRTHNVVAGLLHLGILSVNDGDDATVSCQSILTSSNGILDPIAITDAQTLPTGIVDDERFTIGKVTIAGVLLTQIRSIEIAFGISAEAESSDSDVFPTFASIRKIEPIITIRGSRIEWMDNNLNTLLTIPRDGKPATQVNTILHLRKRLKDATFVPDATAEHIKINAAGLVVVDTPMEGSGTDPAEVTIQLHTKHDGTNPPLVINTASAIV